MNNIALLVSWLVSCFIGGLFFGVASSEQEVHWEHFLMSGGVIMFMYIALIYIHKSSKKGRKNSLTSP